MALQSWAGKHGGATGPGPYAGSLPHLCHIQGGGGGGEGGAGGQRGGGGGTRTYMAQNDRLVAVIILSHVC